MSKSILFVDDEKQILKALRRLFMRTEYNLFLAESGHEALEILKSESIDMMITDMRMPKMDGHELLKRVKEAHPKVIRIALSGFTDKKVVISALDKNLAKIYMFKPWNNTEIISMIDCLFTFEGVLKDKNLLDFISNLKDLPSIPSIYNTVTEMVDNEESISAITKCISEDQAILARILRIANSAYFGAKTGDLNQAVMFLGLGNVKNIILSNAVFSNNNKNMDKIEREWRHASLTNRIMNEIYSKVLKTRLSNEYKSAGLLHNIGKSVIYNNYEQFSLPDGVSSIDDELETLGLTHQNIGSYILDWWELPLPIVECSMYHHNPTDEKVINKELVKVIHVAQHYAYEAMDMTPDGEINMDVMAELGIKSDFIDNVIIDMK